MGTETRRLLTVLVVGLLVSSTGAAWLELNAPPAEASDDPIRAAAVITVPPTTTTTAAPAPATTAAPAPAPAPVQRARQPVAVPKQAYAPEPIREYGTIEIPKIGLSHKLYEGITLRNIDLGPSHWPGTAHPGEAGNAVFAGHRVTKTHPFRNIDQLVEGDEVIFTVNGTQSRYVVTGHEVVTPKALHIVNQTETPTATLFACHPPGSAKYRYVVRLALVQG